MAVSTACRTIFTVSYLLSEDLFKSLISLTLLFVTPFLLTLVRSIWTVYHACKRSTVVKNNRHIVRIH